MHAWGPGAAWSLDGLPELLGDGDDPAAFVAHHPLVADAHRRMPGIRFCATRRVWDVLVPAVLEQKVTSTEARRSWRELCWRFGDPAPGPAPAGLRLPPTPAQIRAVPDWEWHRAGVDSARRRAILACAVVAHRLENACTLGGEPGRELLRRVPGIGVWTAAEVAQRAWGDPDAVSVGDFHIPALVGWALLGRPIDDAQMLSVLAPYVPQRARAVRYVELSGSASRASARGSPRATTAPCDRERSARHAAGRPRPPAHRKPGSYRGCDLCAGPVTCVRAIRFLCAGGREGVHPVSGPGAPPSCSRRAEAGSYRGCDLCAGPVTCVRAIRFLCAGGRGVSAPHFGARCGARAARGRPCPM